MHNLLAYKADPQAGERGPETLHHGFSIRRRHERAYRRWTEMRQGRVCPSIEDLTPASVAGPGDMLMDLRNCEGDPQLVCMGGALLHDCERKGMKRLSEIPSESFLTLLTAHWRHVAAGRAPVAFEGERPGPGASTTYRAILLPLSSDGETVDFIYGSISWREPADDALTAQLENAVRHLGPSCAEPVPSLWPAA